MKPKPNKRNIFEIKYQVYDAISINNVLTNPN